MSDIQVFGGDFEPKRPLWRAMGRGWRGKCPSCGQSHLYSGFVTTIDQCPNCGEHIAHHRADDLPPYLNIFIVGHIVVGVMLLVMRVTDWSAWTHLAIWGPLTLFLALLLMRPLKGAVIGLQWANRMHGFGDQSDHDPTAPRPSDHG
ncbi:MAG: DUF983 domain-containing protein [Pseudomonadota bacterium]